MILTNKNYLGIGMMGLAIIAFWIFMMPAWNRISLLRNALNERESIWQARSEILKRIDDLNKQYGERSSDVSRISAVMPSNKGMAELVSTVETTSKQSGLQLTEITTGGSENKQNETQAIFIELGLTGSYSSLTSFLELLEKNIRLIDVFEIGVSPATTIGQSALNFRVKANVYYLSVKK